MEGAVLVLPFFGGILPSEKIGFSAAGSEFPDPMKSSLQARFLTRLHEWPVDKTVAGA